MVKKSFLDLFPVPEYLRFPAVGMDFCDGYIRFLEIIPLRGGGFEVGAFGKSTFNIGDERVYEKEFRGLVDKFKIKYAHVSLPEEQSYYIKLRLPSVNKKEIRESIELQLEEHVPYPPSELVFDYDIVEESLESSSPYLDVNVSVAPISIVQKYLDVMRHFDITPLSLEIEPESTGRSIVPVNDDSTYMIVKIGNESSVLSIANRGVVWFSYTMKLGGANFTQAIMDGMSVDREEAEVIKLTRGLNRTKENEDVLFCLAPAVSSLRDDIIKHYWYWNAHRSGVLQKEIQKIVLCGCQASINGLPEYLSASLGIPVVLANPWTNIFSFDKEIPKMNQKTALEYATAIGLAMKGIKLNKKGASK